ncbi:acyl carrier protein 1, mitochondrial-like isoform X1 [Miscanthus floridulus]|uniref:acyl carrier protein 1, mitochondrial-like isoform X1 n=1 Tax=Miscanthus floridulus TaxID=154761 RepID=UPI003459CC79
MAAAALRPAILRRIRLSPSPSLALAAAGAGASHPHALARWLAPRPMSSHDAHLTREEVVDRVLDVLKSHPKVEPSKVTPEAHFEKDLGLDSLDTVEVVMAIEEEFKLEIPDMEADKIDSLRLAIEYVANHPMAG